MIKPFFIFSYKTLYKKVDRGLFELIGPVGVTKFLNIIVQKLRQFYNINSLDNFLFFILVQFALVIICLVLVALNIFETISFAEQIVIVELAFVTFFLYKKK